ncbi:MAG: hypothetical protein EOM45_03685 [Clostridia bacterium]|nr:hypothetical protein [Clostridia bacterium]
MKETLNKNENISISELFRIFLKNIIFFFFVFCLIVVVCLLYIGINDRSYTATTTISIESIHNLTKSYDSKIEVRNLTRELQFLTNRNTVQAALKLMDLSVYTHKDRTDYQNLLIDIKQLNNLTRAIKTYPIENSNLVAITLDHGDPLFAQDFLNALVASYEATLLEHIAHILEQEFISLNATKREADENLTKTILELEEIKQQIGIESDLSTEKMVASIINQSQLDEGASLTYLGLSNPELLEIVNTINKEASLLAEYRIQLNILESRMSIPMDVITTIKAVELINEEGVSNSSFLFLIGVLFAAVFALLSVFLVEYLSDFIDDKEVLQRIIRGESKLLSIIPKGHKDSSTELEILMHPESMTSIAYDQLAGILLYSDEKNVFSISSLGYGEGTSYTTLSIALSLAKRGKRILLINTTYEITRCQRLYTKILAHEDLKDVVQEIPFDLERFSNLNGSLARLFVTSIDLAPNGLSQFLHSQQFIDYTRNVSSIFDLVLIAGPTFRTFSDMLAVARTTEGVVLNVGTFVGSRKQLKYCIGMLRLCNTHLQGVILNNICGKPSRKELKAINVYNKNMQEFIAGKHFLEVEQLKKLSSL